MIAKNSPMDAQSYAQKHARILGLWKTGATSGEIAELVKLSRSAVMGILFRARKRGLIEMRKTDTVEKKPRTEPRRARVKRLVLPSVFDPEPDAAPIFDYDATPITDNHEPSPEPCEPVHILDARFGQCRWIVGRAHDNLVNFCGQPTKGGLSYCVAHHKMVYVPFSKMKTKTQPKKAYRF